MEKKLTAIILILALISCFIGCRAEVTQVSTVAYEEEISTATETKEDTSVVVEEEINSTADEAPAVPTTEETVLEVQTEEISDSSDTSEEQEIPANVWCDGLYCYINDDDNNGLTNAYIIRFYDDGGLISTNVEENAAGSGFFPDASCFNRMAEPYVSLVGHYEVNGDEIALQTISGDGMVELWGRIDDRTMILDGYSNIDGSYFSGREYVFYSFEEVEAGNN